MKLTIKILTCSVLLGHSVCLAGADPSDHRNIDLFPHLTPPSRWHKLPVQHPERGTTIYYVEDEGAMYAYRNTRKRTYADAVRENEEPSEDGYDEYGLEYGRY